MASRPQSVPPMRPMNVGNVVSLGIRLYRSHLKSYLSLALQSFLWFFVPIYGWAKIASIQALISRHAFQELVNQPEPISASRKAVKPQMWYLWLIQILVFITLLGINFAISFVASFLALPLLFLVASANNELIAIVGLLIQLLLNLITFYVNWWLSSRLIISEVPLVVEPDLEFSTSISRSWMLTRSSMWRIQLVLLLIYLICAPFIGLGFLPIIFAFPTLVTQTGEQALSTFFTASLVSLLLVLVFSILLSPLWQTVKAVIYYDLRSRREGLDLQLRDRPL